MLYKFKSRATADLIIPPDAQRFMSKRAGAKVVETEGNHAIYVSNPTAVAEHVGYGNHPLMIALAWSAVGIPLAIGIWITLQKALILFRQAPTTLVG